MVPGRPAPAGRIAAGVGGRESTAVGDFAVIRAGLLQFVAVPGDGQFKDGHWPLLAVKAQLEAIRQQGLKHGLPRAGRVLRVRRGFGRNVESQGVGPAGQARYLESLDLKTEAHELDERHVRCAQSAAGLRHDRGIAIAVVVWLDRGDLECHGRYLSGLKGDR